MAKNADDTMPPADVDEVADIDLDAEMAAEAQQREATGKRIALKLGGRMYHFKPVGEWAYATAKDDSDMEAFAEDTLPEDEVDAFLEYTDRPEFTLGHWRKMVDRLTEKSGLGRGKPRGSAKRSRPRRKR